MDLIEIMGQQHHELQYGNDDVNKKLLKIRKSYEKVEVDYDGVHSVTDEFKKAKDRLRAFLRIAATNEQF